MPMDYQVLCQVLGMGSENKTGVMHHVKSAKQCKNSCFTLKVSVFRTSKLHFNMFSGFHD